jgi:regulator of replication initiation timing
MMELTENLIYKLEEKMMLLLSDAEGMRQQIQRLLQENTTLKQEKDSQARKLQDLEQEKSNNTRKLQDLVSLLDSVSPTEQSMPMSAAYGAPVLVEVQG